jgi:Ca2+-binding RTX toxin-like protein
MLRIALLAAVAAIALPTAAEAAVLPSVASDTLAITGDDAPDQIALRVTAPGTLQLDTGAATLNFNRSTFSKIAIRSGGGNDVVRIEDALTEATTIETGAGADPVLGGPAGELISTGDDGDQVAPGAGDDKLLLGAGDDTVSQGDGFDTVDGQSGSDRLIASGSADSEELTLQGFDGKARIARDTGPATTDSTAVETLDVNAAGGQDLIDIGDLGPSDVTSVEADLGLVDGARDQLHVQGTGGFDNVAVRPFNEDVRTEGLDAAIRVQNARAGEDGLTVFGGAGSDFISAENSVGARIDVTLDGGPGSDVLDGTDAADTLRGGPDSDAVSGAKGNDVVDLGDGNDLFTRGAADGFDRVEGGGGTDEISVSGTAADEPIEVQGLLARTRVLFGFAGSADSGDVETVAVFPSGGTDNVTVRDLAGTATKTVNLMLNSADLRVDTATVIGTQGNDAIRLATNGVIQTVSGLPATVNVVNPERGEKVVIDGRDGGDTIDATGVVRDKIQPTLKGGAGTDTILGTPGDDTIAGGVGVDVALMGGGLDTFTWAPGDGNDVVEGQAGTDFLQMNGSGGNDRFDVVPVGGRTRVTRDIENVNLDLGGLERVDLLLGPGGDIVRVGDLSGTATDHVDVNLMVARGQIGGDDLIDRVFVDGTFGNDTINVNGAGPDVRVSGLANITTVRGTDPELDRLHVDTRPGPDTLTVTGTTNQLIGFTFSQ